MLSKKHKKPWMPVVGCALILCAGILMGLYASTWILPLNSDNSLKSIANLSDTTYEAYSKRDPITAKNALLEFLNALNSSIESNKAQKKALLLDKTLTLGRMALIAEKTGNVIDKQAFFELSIASCLESNGEICSEAGIRKRLERIDDSMNR